MVGFQRPHARHSLPSQTAMLDLHGITKRYADLALLIRQRRRGHGDVVAVKRLMLLADPKSRRKSGGMRDALYAAIDALEAAGVTILELETGRDTSVPRNRDLMIREAVDDLAQTRAGTRRPGRPEVQWTPDQQTVMRLHWHNMRHATNDDALAAMAKDGVRASIRQVLKVCGPSGRKAGFRTKIKSKR